MQSQTSFTSFIEIDIPPKNKRGNRNRSPSEEKQKSNEINSSFDDRLVSHDESKTKTMFKSDTSFLHQEDDEEQDQIDRKFREDAISEKQSSKQQDDEELKPDKSIDNKNLNESNWQEDQNKNAKQKVQTVVINRGNRGNRGNQSSLSSNQNNNSKTQSESTPKVNPDHQLPSQSTTPKRRGNRYPENQGESTDYYKRNNDDKRDHFQNYQRGFNKDYNNNGGRGYRQNNWQGRDSNYRGRGGYRGGRGGYNNNFERRNYNNDSDSQNTQKKFETDKEHNQSTYKNPDFQKKSRPYEQKPHYNNFRSGGGYNRDYQPRRSEPEVVEKIIETKVIVQKQKIVEKLVEPPRPIGIRAYPSVSIFIKGCKLQLTCRRLQKFKADLLVIPYKTPKLELYPGTFVNSLKVNYKQKLKQKSPKLEEQNKLVYLQKCFGSQSIGALAFMKVADPQKNIKNGIKELLENIKRIQDNKKKNDKETQKFQSIIFPICSQLQALKTVISTFIKEIQKYSSIVKDVYISTQDPKAFCDAVTKFNQIFVELFEDNQISFN